MTDKTERQATPRRDELEARILKRMVGERTPVLLQAYGELEGELIAAKQEIAKAKEVLDEMGIPEEIHVEGGMAFTGLRPRFVFALGRSKLNSTNESDD